MIVGFGHPASPVTTGAKRQYWRSGSPLLATPREKRKKTTLSWRDFINAPILIPRSFPHPHLNIMTLLSSPNLLTIRQIPNSNASKIRGYLTGHQADLQKYSLFWGSIFHHSQTEWQFFQNFSLNGNFWKKQFNPAPLKMTEPEGTNCRGESKDGEINVLHSRLDVQKNTPKRITTRTGPSPLHPCATAQPVQPDEKQSAECNPSSNGHDEAGARQIFRTGRHEPSPAETDDKFKSALRRQADFVREHSDEPNRKQNAKSNARGHRHYVQQVRRRFPKA